MTRLLPDAVVLMQQVASSFLIELGNGEKFIFDMGTGSYINLIATGVPAAKLNKVSSPFCPFILLPGCCCFRLIVLSEDEAAN